MKAIFFAYRQPDEYELGVDEVFKNLDDIIIEAGHPDDYIVGSSTWGADVGGVIITDASHENLIIDADVDAEWHWGRSGEGPLPGGYAWLYEEGQVIFVEAIASEFDSDIDSVFHHCYMADALRGYANGHELLVYNIDEKWYAVER